MAFGVKREELEQWKARVARGEIAFLTHYWLEPRFKGVKTVTKVGCGDLGKLTAWCRSNGLDPKYIHRRQPFPHFDLIGEKQLEILKREGLWEQVERFKLQD
ncbi:hypothetical protein [Paenibacillus glycinis]|uniref:YneQ n=1 Tax=Paenibacillus glycinis TaxID=2697035 RepID=A0ABW9XSS7_9BACL|nr:hypothetical protein [Paenibacillus glycinis]NBD25708.1 hypothetical protein [Paenibacillus glycinis]